MTRRSRGLPISGLMIFFWGIKTFPSYSPQPATTTGDTQTTKKVAAENEKRAAADRDLAVKKAAHKSEVNAALAAADVASEIERAKQGQTVRALHDRDPFFARRYILRINWQRMVISETLIYPVRSWWLCCTPTCVWCLRGVTIPMLFAHSCTCE